MGRKALFNVKSLEIGCKIAFPERKRKYIYQYLNNFNRHNEPKKFGKFEGMGGELYIERIA